MQKSDTTKWGNSDQSRHKFANQDHELWLPVNEQDQHSTPDTAKEKNVETDDQGCVKQPQRNRKVNVDEVRRPCQVPTSIISMKRCKHPRFYQM